MEDDWTMVDGKWTDNRKEELKFYEVTEKYGMVRIKKLKNVFSGQDFDEVAEEEARELMNNLRRILG